MGRMSLLFSICHNFERARMESTNIGPQQANAYRSLRRAGRRHLGTAQVEADVSGAWDRAPARRWPGGFVIYAPHRDHARMASARRSLIGTSCARDVLKFKREQNYKALFSDGAGQSGTDGNVSEEI